MTKTAAERVLVRQNDIQQWQEDFYRDNHQHPELGHHEVRTSQAVADQLRGFGFDVTDKIGSTGVAGVLHNGDGPVVRMRADMDALPVKEETGLPYASSVTTIDDACTSVPVMHPCGHDAHVTCLLGTAKLMSTEHYAWSGTYIALFQPAEELADGTQRMLEGGLKNVISVPDVALAQHVLPLPSGTVGTRVGPILSRGDSMRVTVWGRASHGSTPQLSVNPAVLAAAIVQRLQGIVSREITSGEFAVLTIGKLAVGSKSNIISDHAIIELNIRTFSDSARDAIVDAIERIVRGECAASGSPKDPEFELFGSFPPD